MGDTNGVSDIFLHDRVTHSTTRVNVGPGGVQGTRPATAPEISANGAVVGFVTSAVSFGDPAPPFCQENDPTNACTRAFVRTLSATALRQLPVHPSWATNYGIPGVPFTARVAGILLDADGGNAITRVIYSPLQGLPSVEFHDLETGAIEIRGGGQGMVGWSTTADGQTVAIAMGGGSRMSPAPMSTISIVEQRSSRTETRGTDILAWWMSPSLSGNGRWIAYSSGATTLIPGDTNELQDIFLEDRDADADGMLTAWETRYGLDPNDGGDAAQDRDGDGVSNLAEYEADTHPNAPHTRYFAEGAANSFFSTRFAIANPDATAAVALVRLLGANGIQRTVTVDVPGQSRITVWPNLEAADEVFSTIVESDRPLVSDRLMTWDGTRYGSSLETSAAAPGTTWYFAEGATGPTYALYYLLQNPGGTPADVTVTYLRPSPQPPIVKSYTVAPHSRFTIDVRAEDAALASAEVSATITSSQPIIAERALYLSTPTQFMAAGHAGSGIAAPAPRWFLAEGATGFFDEFVLIANPNATPSQIRVTYLLEGGQSFDETFQVAGNSRYTIEVKARDSRLQSTPVSIVVESTNNQPIVVERVMWWPQGAWYEASLSAGVTETGTRWAFAEGETTQLGAGAPSSSTWTTQTYLLIANTHPTQSGTATVRLLRTDGIPLNAAVSLPANERTTVDLGSLFPTGSGLYGLIVESDGVPIIAERSIYTTIDGLLYAAGASSVGTNVTPVP